MSPPAAHPRGRPYWLLLVLAGLLLSPPAWASGALIAAAIGVTLVRGLRGRAGPTAQPEAGVLLGTDPTGARIEISDRQLSAHGLILGASGAGKSTTLLTILGDHVRRGTPVVAIDMKGSPAFARQLAGSAAAAGRRFRVWTLDGGDHWNPLAHGNATELKDKLISTERFTEPHYQRAAERYMQTALQVLGELHPERPVGLEEVVRMMDPMKLSGALRDLPRERAAGVRDYLASLTPDQLSAIRGLGTRLAIITESHTGRYLSSERVGGGAAGRRPAIDLRQALEGHEVVLFSLNSSTYGKLAAQVGSLVVQDLVAASGHRLQSESRRQAIVAIDEFSGLGGDHVLQLLVRGRESGISVLLATQELADLDRAAHGFRDQVLGNTAIKLAHRQDVPSSAQTIAQMVGTEQAWEQTRQLTGLFARGHASRGSARLVDRFIVHPNEIKSLPTGQLLMLAKQPRTSARMVHVRHAGQRVGPER